MYDLVKPLIFLLPPETAHFLGLWGVKLIGWLHRMGLWQRGAWATRRELERETPFGKLSAPVGLAAGLDKNGQGLWGWQALGFGFAEVGTITPEAQPGNPKPRLFRYFKHKALVNRLGFNNLGVVKIASNIRKAKRQGLRIKVGGNIGKNLTTPLEQAVRDYRRAALELSDCVDYLVINVSSPNTPGLRGLQTETLLDEIVTGVKTVAPQIPLFIKVAPDGFEQYVDGILKVTERHKLSGIICGNTLANHASSHGLTEREIATLPNGGLSGRPIFENNLRLAESYAVKNPSLFIIGVGGIVEPAQAQRYFQSGIALVQIYTGFIFGGPHFIKTLLSGLV